MNSGGVHSTIQNGLAEADAAGFRKLMHDLGQAIATEARKLGIPAHKMNGAGPSNAFLIRDSKEIHILFERTPNPISSEWIFSRPELTLRPEDVAASGIHEFGFTSRECSIVSFPPVIITMPDTERTAFMQRTAEGFVRGFAKIIDRPRAIAGYEGMQTSLDKFSEDHPDFEKNVFLAMRFEESQQHADIYKAITDALALYGLKCLRADQRVYPVDDDLWTNICTYMMGCSRGICVFEEINVREFNPNVPMEYGFMRAMNRPVLLLKDKRQPRMPTDIVGKVYRDFDTYSIAETVAKRVGDWCKNDLGLKLV